MTNDGARGSDKLMSGLAAKGAASTPDDVKAALAIPATTNYTLQRWQIRGIPPVYYELEAVGEVAASDVASTVQHFAAVPGFRKIIVLPNGVPVFSTAQIETTVAFAGPGA